MLPIILASSSDYRRQLLTRLGLDFEYFSPDIDESAHIDESAQQLACRLAVEKTQAVATHYPNALIIGSDQVASANGSILNKPGNYQRAHQQLSACSGNAVHFYTGLALLNSQTNEIQSVVETFTVHFRTLTAANIGKYLSLEQPYDCAGSFKMEGLGIALFERLEGDDPNSLIGLPLIQLINLLKNQGLEVI
ncbi:nucleoside triphosphate pyrophosphatase [Oceanicoccus sp. KOV_DT_Chl]|uniref:Maf family protein n=1 Tax=Oceanicoccus sp. KOV_DT_Chl TaxID=1904639 RepID=UPI000C7A4FCD|nr:nucleoside triphosphate pyrophosphatase [Oceanicoccus sp. KOV_DT_Chl]